MKAYLFCALVLGASVFADMTQEQRDKVLKATKDIVTEKVDEFEKRVRLSYSGSDIHMPSTEAVITAHASWPENDIQQVIFLLNIERVGEGWRWLKYNTAKILVDGERLEWQEHDLESDVLDGGRVSESKMISVSLRQLMEICAAEKVKMKLGMDEWEWDESRKLPMIAVLAAWVARGGDISKQEDLKKRIFRPQVGMAYGEVVKKHGAPVWKDPQDGWATWEWFWLRFKEGKVIETRPRPIKEKTAH